MAQRTLLQGGTVLTLDEDIGNFTNADVLIEDGKIRSVIDRIYPMEEVAAAHERVETEQRRGTVVLSLTRDTGPSSSPEV